jgi:hypothetical protein
MVAAYIWTAYWFTAFTSFANPAAVFGRMLSDSVAGIAPDSAPGFVLAGIIGGFVGLAIDRALPDRDAPNQTLPANCRTLGLRRALKCAPSSRTNPLESGYDRSSLGIDDPSGEATGGSLRGAHES